MNQPHNSMQGLQILSSREIGLIHDRALGILERTGMRVLHEGVLDSAREAGLTVDSRESRVRFPSKRLMELVSLAPRQFTLGARDPQHDLRIDGQHMHTRCISGPFKILDYPGGQRREATSEDSRKAGILQDGLENIRLSAGYLYPFDVAPGLRDVHLLRILLESTGKHIFLNVYNGAGMRRMVEMLRVLSTEKELIRRPLISVNVTPISPLIFSGDQLEVLKEAGRCMLPVQLGSTPIAGMTAPVTLAGLLTVIHAETLACVCLAQALVPGHPVFYEPRPTTADMRTMSALWGSVEWGLASAASKQLADLVNLPTDCSGGNTDSKVPDQQAAGEKAMNLLMIGLSRPDILSGVGNLETINTACLEQLVIDDELCGMVYRALEGIRVEDDTLSTELIENIGPGGNFLTERHTVDHYEREHYRYSVFNRDNVETWEKFGAKDALAAAHDRVNEILKYHRPLPMDEKTLVELDRVLSFH